MDRFYRQFETELGQLREAGKLRELRTIDCCGASARYEGRDYRNFSGNDYLGIAGDLELRREFYREVGPLGLSAASSRLLTGNSPQYASLEAALAKWYGHGRAALVFNSGYHANLGILPALSRKGDLILSDKLNHASIIDGLRLAEAEFKRYPHGDLARLEALLAEAAREDRRVFIVTESIFSMDGDRIDLAGVVKLKQRYGAFLIVDEAHSVGVTGPTGAGLAEAENLIGEIDIIVGTFGKAFGSAGAYAILAPVAREYLVNTMRTLIFTTGLPPVIAAWSEFVIGRIPAMNDRRVHLAKLGNRLREVIAAKNFRTFGDSQIVPLIVGGDRDALELAAKLRERGILVFAIRPPTVPAGTARLRFSLNATLTGQDVESVEAAL